MNTEQTIQRVRQAVRAARAGGKLIGFVPTMGALHAGHASLIDAARRQCGFVVVSIFVNPTQFAPTEDLGAYPRTPEQDLELCQAHGADLVFLPAAQEMYGEGGLTEVTVKAMSGGLCGASRPTHFAGVCTVVSKLFNIVQPDRAYFGAKDFQQAAIIRRMTVDLNFPIEIVVCPTVREADGLAMSSRNRYLSPQERAEAPAFYGALTMAADLIRAKHPLPQEVKAAIEAHICSRAPLGTVEYVEIVDPLTLCAVQTTTNCPVVIALAVKFGCARLIDNILVNARPGT